jgi:hypothetical protein
MYYKFLWPVLKKNKTKTGLRNLGPKGLGGATYPIGIRENIRGALRPSHTDRVGEVGDGTKLESDNILLNIEEDPTMEKKSYSKKNTTGCALRPIPVPNPQKNNIYILFFWGKGWGGGR